MYLGKPETNEFDLVFEGDDYRVQAYLLGITYAVNEDWGNITHFEW